MAVGGEGGWGQWAEHHLVNVTFCVTLMKAVMMMNAIKTAAHDAPTF